MDYELVVGVIDQIYTVKPFFKFGFNVGDEDWEKFDGSTAQFEFGADTVTAYYDELHFQEDEVRQVATNFVSMNYQEALSACEILLPRFWKASA